MRFEVHGMPATVNGTHMFINPANQQVIDCADLEAAKYRAKMLSVGFEPTVTIYKFVLDGNAGGWRKVWAYRDGRQSWALSKASAA